MARHLAKHCTLPPSRDATGYSPNFIIPVYCVKNVDIWKCQGALNHEHFNFKTELLHSTIYLEVTLHCMQVIIVKASGVKHPGCTLPC